MKVISQQYSNNATLCAYESGPVIIIATDPVEDNKWTTVVAEISYRDGSLVVDNGVASKGGTARCHLYLQ